MERIPKNTTELLRLLQSSGEEEAGQRFLLDNGQLARLSVERRKDPDPLEDGRWDDYPRARVSVDVPRAEQATIAAITALRFEDTEDRDKLEIRRTLPAARAALHMLEALATGEEEPEVPPEASGTTIGDSEKGLRYKWADDLIRHYRPEFEDMPIGEQSNVVLQVTERAEEFVEALRKLALTVQHARPYEGLPTSPIKQAARDVRAAELKDIDGLSHVEIGRRLGARQSDNDEARRDNYSVRTRLVPNGRKILAAALTEEGYQRHVSVGKTEKRRWEGLSKDELHIEHFAAIAKVSADEMRRVMTGTEEEYWAIVAAWDQKRVTLAAMARSAWHTLPR